MYYMKKIRQIDENWSQKCVHRFHGKIAERAEMVHLKFISARSEGDFTKFPSNFSSKHEFHAQRLYSKSIGTMYI